MWGAHHNSVYATEKCEVHITILSMQWKKMWGAHHNSVYAMEKKMWGGITILSMQLKEINNGSRHHNSVYKRKIN